MPLGPQIAVGSGITGGPITEVAMDAHGSLCSLLPGTVNTGRIYPEQQHDSSQLFFDWGSKQTDSIYYHLQQEILCYKRLQTEFELFMEECIREDVNHFAQCSIIIVP